MIDADTVREATLVCGAANGAEAEGLKTRALIVGIDAVAAETLSEDAFPVRLLDNPEELYCSTLMPGVA